MTDNVMSKLVFAALEMIGAIVGFFILICMDKQFPLAGVLFVFPTIMGTLKAVTVERKEIDKQMRLMNLIVFSVSVVAVIGFVLTTIGRLDGNPAVYLALVEPLRYAFYTAFYLRKLEDNDK